MKMAFPLKKMRFVSCTPRQRVLKQWSAVSVGVRPEQCFSRRVKRIDRLMNFTFTRHEIVEEVSLRQPIHPSTERTVSRHE
jgi:hypothetical protein